MEQVQAVPALTLADLESMETQLTQRRDAYVEEANREIAGFNGAIMQVQAQRAFLLEKQKGQEVTKTDSKRRRGKPARKVKEVAVVTEGVTAPEPLAEGG
jgi:hypothetical protein